MRERVMALKSAHKWELGVGLNTDRTAQLGCFLTGVLIDGSWELGSLKIGWRMESAKVVVELLTLMSMTCYSTGIFVIFYLLLRKISFHFPHI